jgi:hypothetical protein
MDYFAGLDISMDETYVAFLTVKGRSFAGARRRRQQRLSPANCRKRLVVGGSYSRPDGWRRSCSTG